MIRERSELDAIASEIHASGQRIALDIETYGTSEDKKIRKEATEVIGHNIKCDALWLARKCNVHLIKMIDTSSASRILSNGDSKVGNRLAEAADRYLGSNFAKTQEEAIGAH